MQPKHYKVKGIAVSNPKGWFSSIKLDGMKGIWADGVLRTRSGSCLKPPKWFTDILKEHIGKYSVEGELYLGKGTFHQTASLRGANEAVWKRVVFKIFDLIDEKRTWSQRQAKLIKISQDWPDSLQLVKWKPIESASDVERRFERAKKNGDEGLIIANPKGMYCEGYTNDILKYKVCNDMECVITGYELTGNRLASLKCSSMDRKVHFHVGIGFKEKERLSYETLFPVGAVVTCSYELLSKSGKPRTPVFKGIRIDL